MNRIFSVKPERIRYTDESKIPSDYTHKMDKAYDWMAKVYDAFMFVFPVWKKWIIEVIPHIQGTKILEVSFGNGYLMSKYAQAPYEIHGVDYNEQMVKLAREKMEKTEFNVELRCRKAALSRPIL